MFAETCKLAGLSVERDDPNKVVPHTLRHTCASWLLDQGKSPWQVGQYLGMTAQMVERTYGHPNEEGQRETANAMRPSHSRPTDTRKRA